MKKNFRLTISTALVFLAMAGMLFTAGTAQAEPAPETGYPESGCIVVFGIRQSTFTLDIFEHMKNSINEQEFAIPVDCGFYNTLRVDDELHSKFKWGSFVFDGDLSKLKVTVKSKRKVSR